MASTRTRCCTHAPAATKSSAAAVCWASSRVASRTRTFVSTARMAALHEPPHPFLELLQGPGLWSFREERPVHLLRRKATGPPDHDPFALLLPFQDRARPDAQPAPDLSGYRDLALCGDFRVCD